MTNSAFKSLLTFLCSSLHHHCSLAAARPRRLQSGPAISREVRGARSDRPAVTASAGGLSLSHSLTEAGMLGERERERERESCHQGGVMELCVVTSPLLSLLTSQATAGQTKGDTANVSQSVSQVSS